MRWIAVVGLLLLTACATGLRDLDAAFLGHWSSISFAAENGRKDECTFENGGAFYCISTSWKCQSCQGESLIYSGTWKLDGSHLSRRITVGREAGSTAVDEIVHLDAGEVTFADGTRWVRE